MQRQFVSSSNVQSIGYDAGTSTLEIEFHGGGVYQYTGVPTSVFNALMRASSKGTYFHAHIKDRYPTRRVA